jgi:prefoldin beta subunit
MDIPKETQESINKLQMIEQNVQALQMQKQQFQAQLFEIDSALKEIERTDDAYKIVGNVMIKADKTALKAELGSKKEILDLRLKNIDKQEKQLKDKAETLQKEVMSKLKK